MSVSRRFIGFGVGAAVAVPLALVGSVNAEAATETLLSQNRIATASSVQSSSYPATAAVDGNADTRWASTAGAAVQWLQVDLGSVDTITHVKLRWSKAYAKGYQILASTDGTAWSPMFTTTAGNGGTDELTGLTATGRYVRVRTTTPATTQGASVWELKVYGHPAGTTPAPKPVTTPAATPPVTAPVPVPEKTSPGGNVDLTEPHRKEMAMQLVSSAENSSLNWRAQHAYIEDIGDGRGYTGGIIGFCSGTSDMLQVVEAYTAVVPGNILAKYLPALRKVNGSASHAGLDPGFPADWRTAAADPAFQTAQDNARDRIYFNPAVAQGKADGLHALGQFIYYDALVMHGPGSDPASFGGIRRAALAVAKSPAQGGSETEYLNAFLNARKAAMMKEAAHSDTTRVDTAQRVFLANGNLGLNAPLSWKVYGDTYEIVA